MRPSAELRCVVCGASHAGTVCWQCEREGWSDQAVLQALVDAMAADR